MVCHGQSDQLYQVYRANVEKDTGEETDNVGIGTRLEHKGNGTRGQQKGPAALNVTLLGPAFGSGSGG
jgi:hypothetical protein